MECCFQYIRKHSFPYGNAVSNGETHFLFCTPNFFYKNANSIMKMLFLIQKLFLVYRNALCSFQYVNTIFITATAANLSLNLIWVHGFTAIAVMDIAYM